MKTILTIILTFYCTGIYAANAVDLFDEARGQEKNAEPANSKAPRKINVRTRGVLFSLTGISKIGDKYVIYFDAARDQRKSFSWHEQQKSAATTIYNDYEIAKIIDRTVYLNIVTSKPCIENQLKGISCDQKNRQMIMQLVRKKAIASTSPGKAKGRAIREPAAKTNKRPRKFPFKQKLKNK
ncbi:MAG: hypothetical protein QNL62_02080 [Gammaproteobacteria bacterium]|nr:hypothetical protein [Gammaproteobacteria bacterium]